MKKIIRQKSVIDFLEKMAEQIGRDEAESFRSTFSMCGIDPGNKSPIEQMLAVAFHYFLSSKAHFGHMGFDAMIEFEDWQRKTLDDIKKQPRSGDITIYPQLQIGQYFADFLIANRCFSKPIFCVVECDGHDFHEKTKEQAARDKRRDRYFQSLGLIVLRFTGSEIVKDPLECADFVFTTIDELGVKREIGE